MMNKLKMLWKERNRNLVKPGRGREDRKRGVGNNMRMMMPSTISTLKSSTRVQRASRRGMSRYLPQVDS
jgi:hypothetical protein